MKKIIYFVISLLVLLAFIQDARPQAYKYVDKNGVSHFTEDFGTIPEEYRNQVKKQDWWEEKAAQPIEEREEKIGDKTEKSRKFYELCAERNHHLAMAQKTFPEERNISKAWSMYYEKYLTEEERERIPRRVTTETDPCRKNVSAGGANVPRTDVTKPTAQGPSSYSSSKGRGSAIASRQIIASDRNPQINSSINPKVNASINPQRNLSLNPNSNFSLVPTKPLFSGLYVFDLDGNVAGVAVRANPRFLVFFDAQVKWVGYFCSNNAGGYNWFNVDGNWLGFFIHNSGNGFNMFSKDGAWIGYLN